MSAADVAVFRKVLNESRNILLVSGAGLSAPSGIATFRGVGGRWRKYDSASLATLSAWQENQSRVWQFFHYRREEVRPARPNEGHYALARLCFPTLRNSVAPNAHVVHITQNIDGLCQTSLNHVASQTNQSPDGYVIEMHGNLFDVVCTAHDCMYQATNLDAPICPALGGTEMKVAAGDVEPVVKRKDLPHCPECHQLLRPDVVWFGERPKRIQEILQLANNADLCIMVGTSAVVQPASKLYSIVKENGGKLAIFNLEPPNHSEDADFIFLGSSEVILKDILGI
ncbi:DHS-like NAD/FAD-binding domain-containing protein [Flagelloscypha sp. PMI_526]|nr:DHS-like NAD/FAD-binding domain-containing protein [Flagelloscypha sp. PMI_526]